MHNKYMKSYNAETALPVCTIVKPGVSGGVVPASAATDKIVGVTDNLAIAQGQTTDVSITGEHFVKFGGTVTFMDPLTSDGNGNAIVAAPAAGANVRIIGYALQGGVSGDIGTYMGSPATLQG